jgi:hypothetical protein
MNSISMNGVPMKIRLLFAVVLGLALGTVSAQGQGQRGGPGGWGGGMGAGNGMTGTVTEVAIDHYTIKTDTGETYTVHFSANTRIMKQTVQRRSEGGEGGNSEPAAPQKLNPADIKVGDVVAAMGEVDAAAKSVGAMMVVQIDPERAKQMREMRANYGKTWLMGKVTAINETKIALQGTVDNAAHAFVANEDTSFRKRREYMTLADLQVGDMVRVEGAVKDGIFVATLVNVMGMPQGGMPAVPHDAAPAPQPK